MKYHRIPQTDVDVSAMAFGCDFLTRAEAGPDDLNEDDIDAASRIVNAAFDNGITLFDTAAGYQRGGSEAALGRVMGRSPGLRSKIVVQTKCSPPHTRASIVASAETSLGRLGTDYLDLLLLHIQDPLVDPTEVAEAFDELHRSGKVRFFGVSNHTPGRLDLLAKTLRQPLVVNQIHLGLVNSSLLDEVFLTWDGRSLARFSASESHNGIAGLDYSRLHDMQVEAYSPLRGKSVVGPAELLGPPADASAEVAPAAERLQAMAAEKGVTPAALGFAWLLRHPGRIIPIVGSKRIERIADACTAGDIDLSHEEWVALWTAGRD